MRHLLHANILLTFALIPVWYRLPVYPALLTHVYVSRFLILLPMLATILVWLLAGLPGFLELCRDRLRSLWSLSLLSLTLWVFASQLWAFQRLEHPDVGQTAALQFGVVALFSLVVACAGPPRSYVIAVLVFSLLWNSLLGGAQVAQQGSILSGFLGEFTLSIERPGVSVVQAGDIRWLRPYGLLPHPNPLGGVIAIGLPAVGAWMVSERRALWVIGTVTAMLGLWVFGLTFSRAAWGGFTVGTLAMIPLLWRGQYLNRRVWLSAGLLLIVVALFFMAYRPFLLARSGVGAESIEQRSVSDRLVFINFAGRAIRESPILGVGVGNFPWKSSYYLTFTEFDLLGDNVHNIYLSVWAELGTIGLILYGMALLTGLGAGVRELLARPDPAEIAILGGVFALLAIGLLDHYPYSLIQFQTALWGLLAVNISTPNPSPTGTQSSPKR